MLSFSLTVFSSKNIVFFNAATLVSKVCSITLESVNVYVKETSDEIDWFEP